MKWHVKLSIAVIGTIAAVFAVPLISSTPVMGLNKNCTGFDCITNTTNKNEINAKKGNASTVQSFAKTATNTLLYLVGAIAVIMIVYGGISYVISNGDAAKVTKAKGTVIYAIAGLVIAIVAFAIVNFVSTTLNSPAPATVPNTTKPTITPKL